MRGAVRVFWTLSYEMVFYLVVSGLFAWRLHRHSGWWASGLALTAALAGPWLPDGLLLTVLGGRRPAAAVLLVLVAGCVAAFLRGRTRIAGLTGIGFVLVPALDARPGPQSMVIGSWQGLLLLAVMFAGTVVHRAQHGQLGRGPAALSLTVVAGGLIAAHWNHVHSPVWPVTVTAVAATFGLAFASRGRRVPGILRFLGTVSYSMYVLHLLVVMVLARILPGLADRPPLVRAGAAVAFLVVTLGVAWASYRLVERPGQALGRRILLRIEPPPVPARDRITTVRAVARTAQGENVGASV
jgi:peptidoglycan/LPS O-acetylase OafA/YrhL